MAEADITTMAALANGATAYGDTIRGAWATLQDRQTADQVTASIDAAKVTLETQHGISQVSSGPLTIPWANGRHFRVTSNGFNITSIVESGGATGSRIYPGTIEILNTHGSTTITVDSTGLDYGLDEVVSIAPGGRQMLEIRSTS